MALDIAGSSWRAQLAQRPSIVAGRRNIAAAIAPRAFSSLALRSATVLWHVLCGAGAFLCSKSAEARAAAAECLRS